MILTTATHITIEDYQNIVNEHIILKNEYNILKEENLKYKQDFAILKHELDNLKRMIFGSKSERFIAQEDNQQKLDFQVETKQPEPPQKETITITREKKPFIKHSKRLALPLHLPRKEEVIEPENIPHGSKKIGELVTEILEYTPGKLYVLKIIRPKYVVPACKCKENQTVTNIQRTENNIENQDNQDTINIQETENNIENLDNQDTINIQETENNIENLDNQDTINIQEAENNIENQDNQELKSPIIVAQLPSLPIPKGNAGPGLLAHIFVSKFVDHLPFYRQVQMLKRDNIHHIAEGTINGWFNQICRLLEPLYYKLKNKVLQSGYVMADETPIDVLTSEKPGSTHQGYHWVYYSSLYKLVYFDYRKGRGREGPMAFFKDYKGTIQTDGYVAYDIFDEKLEIVLLACMTHARRKFEHSLDNDKQRAEFALDKMQALYAIERQARNENLSFEQRYQLRQQKSISILNELETWMKKELPLVLPKSAIGGAIAYTLGLWHRLVKYTTDGRYEIDNNLIENSIRPVALGRKNYLFAGSHQGAEHAAMMYSFFGSCKINDVNPTEWLKHVLTVIQDYKANQLNDLLPDNWHNISSKN
jgi:transposase